jgi:uncharacterized protein YbbC (DUF1343 family)
MTLRKNIILTLALTTLTLSATVKPGIEVFLQKYTSLVKGKRVGLITNPTGVASNLTPTVDLLNYNKNVDLRILMAPEHGIRGAIAAGDVVKNRKDSRTGLPVYTLYGHKDHRPTQEALNKIDTIIYDIQDVGSRAYTFIWTLAEAMAAAKLNNKSIIVLDRPSPTGGLVVDGYITEQKWLSFIGLYPIPRVYGMTVGELALLLNKEFKINCHLIVIPMTGYRRGMTWAQTGLPWVIASPHIPTVDSAINFAATGTIGTLGNVSIGIGYTLPFSTIAAPWINAANTEYALNRLHLPGVHFRAIHYKPLYGAYKGQLIHGVQLHITNINQFKASTTETAILYHLKNSYPRYFTFPKAKWASFDKAMGTSRIREMITARQPLNKILSIDQPRLNHFKAIRKKYLIY